MHDTTVDEKSKETGRKFLRLRKPKKITWAINRPDQKTKQPIRPFKKKIAPIVCLLPTIPESKELPPAPKLVFVSKPRGHSHFFSSGLFLSSLAILVVGIILTLLGGIGAPLAFTGVLSLTAFACGCVARCVDHENETEKMRVKANNKITGNTPKCFLGCAKEFPKQNKQKNLPISKYSYSAKRLPERKESKDDKPNQRPFCQT